VAPMTATRWPAGSKLVMRLVLASRGSRPRR
jgi:hypothetical protein